MAEIPEGQEIDWLAEVKTEYDPRDRPDDRGTKFKTERDTMLFHCRTREELLIKVREFVDAYLSDKRPEMPPQLDEALDTGKSFYCPSLRLKVEYTTELRGR